MATIVPSLWYEVFGLVILEAFANGTPVIVRNRGGMPKIIKESGGGFIFDTEEELVNAMDQLLGDQNLRQEIGWRGYETLRQKWSPDVYISGISKLSNSCAFKKREAQGMKFCRACISLR